MNKRKRVNILEIEFDVTTRRKTVKLIKRMLKNSKKQFFAVTPNPEIVLKSQRNEKLKRILNNANLVLPDGVGIKIASFLFRKKLDVVTGADITQDLLRIAQKNNYKVQIMNLKNGLSSKEEIIKSLNKLYPGIKIKVSNVDKMENNLNIEAINKFKPKIMFVNTGCHWQEFFIDKYLKQIPSVKFAIGVGGSFDFLTGNTRRAPLFMRNIGLEWFWQFCERPIKKWRRTIDKIIIFPYKFILWALMNKRRRKLLPKMKMEVKKSY